MVEIDIEDHSTLLVMGVQTAPFFSSEIIIPPVIILSANKKRLPFVGKRHNLIANFSELESV